MKRSREQMRVVGLALGVVLILVAAGCGGKTSSSDESSSSTTVQNSVITVAPPGPPRSGGTITIGLTSETNGWDPGSNQWANSATTVSNAIFDHLMMLDPSDKPKPYLSESVTSNDDFTKWTIKLRPGVTFHDGEPLDAAAVKTNVDHMRSSLLLGPALQLVTDTVVVDDLTLDVVMSEPWSTYPASLATQAGVVAAPNQLSDPEGSRNPIGTGPFVFKTWIPDNKLTVERNPNYWRQGAPYLDGITFKVITDTNTRSAALDAGDVEAIESTAAGQITNLLLEGQQGKIQVYTNELRANMPLQYVGLNTAKPPFDDPLARQIVATGVDTKYLSDNLYKGLFPPASSLFPTGSPLYDANSGYPSYDTAKAKDLADQYKAAHGGQPLSFTVNIPPTPEFKAAAETMQDQARAFGVEVKINPIEQTKLIVDALTGDYEATGFGTFGEEAIDQVFFSGQTLKPLGTISLNFTRMQSDQIDAALAAIRATDDPGKQKEQWDKVQQAMAQDLNMIFLVHLRTAFAYTNNVFGFTDGTFPDGSPTVLSTSPLTFQVWKQ